MEDVLTFVPEEARIQVKQLIETSKLRIKITKKRQTKHGDFRKMHNCTSLITLNITPNPYRFLITLLHELAHFKVSQATHYLIRPHGKEWKSAYKNLVLEFLNPSIFPEPLCSLFAAHMINPKASTDRDFALVMALKKYDPPSKTTHLFELADGQQFQLENGREFVKIKKRRIRFECEERVSGRVYLFSPHAEVIPSSSSSFSFLR